MSTSFKGLTITVGADTKQFNKEMRAVDRSIRGTNRQVNELQKGLELEFDAGRFAEAQRLAQKAIQDTEMKAQALRDQLKYLEETGGDTQSQQFQRLQAELVKTENNAVLLKNRLEEIKNIRIENLAKQFEDVGKGITKAGQVLAPFSAAAAGTLAGLGAMFKNTKDTAAALDDMRQEVNLSAEALQKWQYIAAQQGLDQSTLQNSLIRTQQAFSKLVVDGTGPGAEALMQLGFTAEEAAKGMDANYEVMLQRLSQVTDATQQAYLANEIFGNRMGAKIIPMLNGGAEGLKQLTAEFEALGYMTNEQITALADFDDELLRIKTALGAIKDQVSVALIPVMETLSTFMSTKVIPAVQRLAEWFTGLSDSQKNMLIGTLTFVASLAPALIIIGKLTTGIGGMVKAVGGLSKALSFLAAHPIIAIIGVIATLIGILYTTNEQFRESINALVGTLGEALMPLLGIVGDLFNVILQALNPLIQTIGALLVPAIQILSVLLAPIIKQIEILGQTFKWLADIIGKALTKTIDTILNPFLGFLEGFVNGAIDMVNALIDSINSLGKYLGFTIDKLDHVSLAIDTNPVVEQNKGKEAKIPSVSDTVKESYGVVSGQYAPVTNNDYSNKNITIEVVVQNYAEEVDVDNLVEQINIKLAEQM